MKVNRSITDIEVRRDPQAGGYGDIDNRVEPKYFRHFCKWMVEYVKLHEAYGVPFHAVSPGNEVQFTQSFESCVWDAQDFVTIVADARRDAERRRLRPREDLRARDDDEPPVRRRDRLVREGDPERSAGAGALDVFATHGYEDGVKGEMSATSSRRLWDLIAQTGKPFDHFEAAPAITTGPRPYKRGIGNALHNAGGGPPLGVRPVADHRRAQEHSRVDGDEHVHAVKTYTTMHYTRFIRPPPSASTRRPASAPCRSARSCMRRTAS